MSRVFSDQHFFHVLSHHVVIQRSLDDIDQLFPSKYAQMVFVFFLFIFSPFACIFQAQKAYRRFIGCFLCIPAAILQASSSSCACMVHGSLVQHRARAVRISNHRRPPYQQTAISASSFLISRLSQAIR